MSHQHFLRVQMCEEHFVPFYTFMHTVFLLSMFGWALSSGRNKASTGSYIRYNKYIREKKHRYNLIVATKQSRHSCGALCVPWVDPRSEKKSEQNVSSSCLFDVHTTALNPFFLKEGLVFLWLERGDRWNMYFIESLGHFNSSCSSCFGILFQSCWRTMIIGCRKKQQKRWSGSSSPSPPL